MLTIPDIDGLPATDRLLRPLFGMHRFEWPDDESVEFHLSHGDMIRLLRRCGLEVEDLLELRPEPGAAASHPLATIEWARADEVLITSTAGGIMPVTVIDGAPVGTGTPGPLTRQLRDRYWASHQDPRYSTPVRYEEPPR